MRNGSEKNLKSSVKKWPSGKNTGKRKSEGENLEGGSMHG
jgi:hypothetical protein